LDLELEQEMIEYWMPNISFFATGTIYNIIIVDGNLTGYGVVVLILLYFVYVLMLRQ